MANEKSREYVGLLDEMNEQKTKFDRLEAEVQQVRRKLKTGRGKIQRTDKWVESLHKLVSTLQLEVQGKEDLENALNNCKQVTYFCSKLKRELNSIIKSTISFNSGQRGTEYNAGTAGPV